MNIETLRTEALRPSLRAELLALLSAAYGDALEQYLLDIGPGRHWLGRVDGGLVSHAMVVPRWLQPAELPALRTAYVELVATHPQAKGRGYASRLLRELDAQLDDFELAALSPSDAAFYVRLGWELWRGPLAARTEAGVIATPDEQVMVLRLPRTPADLDLDGLLSVEWRPGEIW